MSSSEAFPWGRQFSTMAPTMPSACRTPQGLLLYYSTLLKRLHIAQLRSCSSRFSTSIFIYLGSKNAKVTQLLQQYRCTEQSAIRNQSAYKHIYQLCTLLLPFVFINYTANPVSLSTFHWVTDILLLQHPLVKSATTNLWKHVIKRVVLK